MQMTESQRDCGYLKSLAFDLSTLRIKRPLLGFSLRLSSHPPVAFDLTSLFMNITEEPSRASPPRLALMLAPFRDLQGSDLKVCECVCAEGVFVGGLGVVCWIGEHLGPPPPYPPPLH